MRRLFIISGFILMALVCNAQSRYAVYKCTEGVSVKKFKSDQWVAAKKHDEVSLVDFLKIDEGGLLVVLDNRNRSLYKFGATGEKSLKALIDETVRMADNVTANLNKELLSNIDKDSKTYTRVAVAYRGDGTSPSFVDSLAAFVKEELMSGGKSVLCYGLGTDDGFALDQVEVSADDCYFRFINGTSDDVFANVLFVHADGHCSLCYDFDYTSAVDYLLLPSQKQVETPQYLFAQPLAGERYCLLIASEPYDTHALQQLLN